MSSDEPLIDLTEAARRAGYIVTEQIESIIARAHQEAETIRREAERDAEDMRREAVEASNRLLSRLHALEFPLGELVVGLRDEVDHVSRQLEKGEHVDSNAISLPSGPAATGAPGNSSQGPARAEEPIEAQETAEWDASQVDVEATSVADQEGWEDSIGQSASAGPSLGGSPAGPPDVSSAAVAEPDRSGLGQEAAPPEDDKQRTTLRGRRRQKPGSRKGLFVTSPGECAVCHREFMAGSAEALELSGWRVNGEVGLCPDCQASGWQLPDGARLPVRSRGR